jgi:hypothetical protein
MLATTKQATFLQLINLRLNPALFLQLINLRVWVLVLVAAFHSIAGMLRTVGLIFQARDCWPDLPRVPSSVIRFM